MGRWLIRLIPRAALAAIFIRAGWRGVKNPEPIANVARNNLPIEPPQLATIARAQAGAQLAGGVALAAGVAPRLAAAGLALTLIPVTYAGHPFWQMDDPQQRNQHLSHFFKNLGLFGGLMYVALEPRHDGSQQG